MTSIGTHVREQRDRQLIEPRESLRIPSISTDPVRAADVRRSAEWVPRRIGRAGCTRPETCDTRRHPIVHREWLGPPGKPTVLFRGHCDMQPVDSIAVWTTLRCRRRAAP